MESLASAYGNPASTHDYMRNILYNIRGCNFIRWGNFVMFTKTIPGRRAFVTENITPGFKHCGDCLILF